MIDQMTQPSFPSSAEHNCSGSKSSSATSYGAFPFVPLCTVGESLSRLWLFLTRRSTRANSFFLFLSLCVPGRISVSVIGILRQSRLQNAQRASGDFHTVERFKGDLLLAGRGNPIIERYFVLAFDSVRIVKAPRFHILYGRAL